MKKLIQEFKEFISRGNVLDMAVGVIIGAAFKAIIDSLVNNVIMPCLTLLTGKMDFTNLFIALDGNKYATLAAAQEAGAATLNYGSFISAVINFFIMAIVIFALIKTMNTISKLAHKKKEEEAPAAPTTKKCPFCCSEIAIEATKCPHCTSEVQ
jgi:large conductance mechanosensitive channel